MLIGSKSTHTILDILKLGIAELVRQGGIPAEVRCETRGCEIRAKAKNFTKRVDTLSIVFHVKSGVDLARVTDALGQTGVDGRVKMDNGICALALPRLEWRHLPKLRVIDKVVEDCAAYSLHSQSWEVEAVSYQKQGFNVNRMVEEMRAKRASDLHLRAGSPPFIRVDNDLTALDMPALTKAEMEEIVLQVGGHGELDRLKAERETSFQFHVAGVGYFRVSGYFKQGTTALALRLLSEAPVPFERLNIPAVVREIADAPWGLFLVCGITGSGKTTTLASLVNYISENRKAHIVTIEDPIEYVFKDKKSIVSQRQVGRDTLSFANALQGALREDPDVILVGEMRDAETIRAAISAAETGHLVFSTLHTMTAVDTIDRIISFFPQAERELIRQELSYVLRGVVCQRLMRRKGKGRVPCVEILQGSNPIVREAILEGEIDKLAGIIELDDDMKSFDQHAVELYQRGIIAKEEALTVCKNEEAFERIISGIKSFEGRKLLG